MAVGSVVASGRVHRRYSGVVQRLRSRLASQAVLPSSGGSAVRRTILGDAYLTAVYRDAYDRLMGWAEASGSGPVVEVGSGSGVAHAWYPSVICLDIDASADPDLRADATRLPFRDGSVAALILKDAFHHIPDAAAFLRECDRVVAPGGVVAMSEPYWGGLARLIYRWLHPEPFEPDAVDWSFASLDAWDSNQALPWMVFVRDADRLSELLPDWVIGVHAPSLGPSYVLSGGVFGRTPVPARVLLAAWRIEKRLGHWFDPFRLEVTIVARRVDDSPSSGDRHTEQNVTVGRHL